MNLPAARRVQDMVNVHELEAAVRRKAIKVHRAEVAMDAVLKPKVLRAVQSVE